MRVLKLSCVALFVVVSSIAASQQPAAALKIVVLEGEDAVNIIQQKTAVQPIVEVRDRNNLPVAGVPVTFTIGGAGGGGAAFAGGAQTLSVVTDAAGRAVVSGLQPAGNGAFSINVTASYQGQTASASITQTNFATTAQAAQAGKVPGSQSSSAGSSGSTGATTGTTTAGAAGATGAATAAGGGAAAGGGLSGLAIGGIVAGGAVGGIVAAKAVSDSGGGDEDDIASCTSQENALQAASNSLNSSLNTYIACINSANTPGQITACQTPINNSIQQVLTAASDVCTCAGTNFSQFITAEERAAVQEAFAGLREAGFNVGALPSCYR